eukprot:CAMPEP_0170460384 /NCGR_PEP_ID=MMETSP0123-20130129/6764_1 /TAXON_ID=182087 /ORGANISM="Favella ehrenbergii, Strain Fehren 1" /LENGTH=217 /DNA_ID=CAMNT_0010725299 /DNA_START=582 /DNA_END=1236 /DNA_ORIENTATION=+
MSRPTRRAGQNRMDGVDARELLKCAEPEAHPGSAADLRVHESLLDGLLLSFALAFALVAVLVESVEAAAHFGGLVELFEDSQKLFISSIIFEEDRRLVAEHRQDHQQLNSRDDEGQGPNDAEVLVRVEVMLGVARFSDFSWVGQSQSAGQGSAESQRELVDSTEWSQQFNRGNLVDELGAEHRESAVADTPQEATDAHQPDVLTNERDAHSNAKDRV